MVFPFVWTAGRELRVERCASDGFGRTSVVCSFAGAPVKPFTLPQDVDVVGFDALKESIETTVMDQVADALEAAD